MSGIRQKIEGTLLERFISSKYGSYVEPERKGIPRGDPIGLSKMKYYASLLMITNVKKKDIATEVDVSYELLRKWNTEGPFKTETARHQDAFARLAYTRLRNIFLARFDYEYRRWKGEAGKLKKPDINLEDFGDIDMYSPRLKLAIMNLVGLNTHTFIDALIASYIKQAIKPQLSDAIDKVILASAISLAEEIRKYSAKKSLTYEDRESLLKASFIFNHYFMAQMSKLGS